MVVDVMVMDLVVSPLTGSVPRQNPVLPSHSSLPLRGPTCLDRKWQLRTVLHRPTTTCCCRVALRSNRRPPNNALRRRALSNRHVSISRIIVGGGRWPRSV